MNQDINTQIIKSVSKSPFEAIAPSIRHETPFLTSIEARNERWAICGACESLDGDSCKECGCMMRKKTYVRGASCLLGKW